jgi:signal transduction histidine kinase
MMAKEPVYTGPVSLTLRRHPHGDKTEIVSTIRWVALACLFLFLTLTFIYILMDDYVNALASAIGIMPQLLALKYLRQAAVSIPSTMLAITIILLITWLATNSQGIYDIGVLAYPVILIVAGLVLRGRVILYLAALIILCLGWLTFGNFFGAFEIDPIYRSYPQDFFIGSIIILVAGNAVFRLAGNVYRNLTKAENEIESRKKAEREREALIRQLRLKNQELDRFAIRVSHDLKTPLITVAGFLGYLEQDIKSGNHMRAEKDLAQINEAAKKMGKFVDELLDLSRVGRITNPPKEVAFEEILRDALAATDGILKVKQVQVEIAPIFPFVHVDRVRMVQVLQNLITNAVKFMGDQPEPIIRIGFQEVDGEHIFSIADNGIGIPPEHQERIFELFNRLNPEIDGTGIGLGLVKRIVEVHHGKIWVESEPGKGATFFFTLAERNQQETV